MLEEPSTSRAALQKKKKKKKEPAIEVRHRFG